MNLPVIAVLPLASMNVPDRLTKGGYIVRQRELNGGQFPNTFAFSEADMSSALMALSDAHTATQSKSALSYAQEKEAKERFDLVFGAWRDWANQSEIAYNNKVKIELLGLDASRPAQPAGAMPAPVLGLPTGEVEGELNLQAEKIDGFASIVWFVAYGETMPADDDFRYHDGSTTLRHTLKGLASGQRAWIKALAIGSKGAGELGAAVCRRVL